MARPRARHIAAAAALVVFGAAILDAVFPPPLDRALNVSPLALDAEGAWLHAFANSDGRWRFAADLETIDPVFLERLVSVEDQRFYRHWGVDPLAAARAGASSLRAGRIVSGASTITMQTARLLEPRPRTPGSKAIEMIRALQIERRLSKDEILSLYLTLAPYGGNLEGVRAASLAWFGREPTRLTDSQQALLIALPQAPETRRPDLHAAQARAARAAILEKLARAGRLSPARAAEAANDPLPDKKRGFPRLAWHAAREQALPVRGVVRTSLDARLQRAAEALVVRAATDLDDGAAVSLLIIENKTRAVRAAVGSPGTDAPGGWIDLTRAVRSPGSALKPFIYAIAFDDGRLAPAALIDDMPRVFGDYAPENFDRRFRGEVTAADALKHSLNVPAVLALDAVGPDRFRARIDAAGVRLRTASHGDDKPGLALALGGAGVTARDLAMLYAGLANGGAIAPLRWRAEDGDGPAPYRLLSAGAAARVNAILADGPTLAGRAPAALAKGAARIAFKTGTSYGYRDAWAAGHNAGRPGEGYTVVAWVGRADGAPRPDATGRKAAAPLLFAAFDLIGAFYTDHPEGPGAIDPDNLAPAIARLGAPAAMRPPEIVFPRNGAEIFVGPGSRGVSLAARGGAGDYRWYVDGAPTRQEGGQAIWRPRASGFYDVVVTDGAGRSAASKVRVRAPAPS